MRNSHLDALQLPQATTTVIECVFGKIGTGMKPSELNHEIFRACSLICTGGGIARLPLGRLMASSLGSRISEVKAKVRVL